MHKHIYVAYMPIYIYIYIGKEAKALLPLSFKLINLESCPLPSDVEIEVVNSKNVYALIWKFYSQIYSTGMKLVLMFLRDAGGGKIDLS